MDMISQTRDAAAAYLHSQSATLIEEGYATPAQIEEMQQEISTGEPIVRVVTKTLKGPGNRVHVAAWLGIASEKYDLHPTADDPESTSINTPEWARKSGGRDKLAAWWSNKHYPGIPQHHQHFC